jgi:hypothetical protein
MKLQEIKQAIEDGKTVNWSNSLYEVVKSKYGELLIRCKNNDHCIGLTWQDGVTMNGKEEDFFIKQQQ